MTPAEQVSLDADHAQAMCLSTARNRCEGIDVEAALEAVMLSAAPRLSPTFRAIQAALDKPPGTLRYLRGGERYEANDVYEFTDPRGYHQVRVVGAPDSLTKPGSLVTMQAVYQTRPRRYGA